MQTHAVRLVPGDDLRLALRDFVQQQQIQAGVILSAIGSLTQANLRFAARSQTTTLPGPLELISLDGTLSPGWAAFTRNRGR